MIPHLSLARKLAGKSTHRQHHHAAFVIRGGAIVATGYNHGSRHAEIVALSKLWPSNMRGCVVWSYRFSKSGNPAMAKPCKRCQAELAASGVRVVHYSTSVGFDSIRIS